MCGCGVPAWPGAAAGIVPGNTQQPHLWVSPLSRLQLVGTGQTVPCSPVIDVAAALQHQPLTGSCCQQQLARNVGVSAPGSIVQGAGEPISSSNSNSNNNSSSHMGSAETAPDCLHRPQAGKGSHTQHT